MPITSRAFLKRGRAAAHLLVKKEERRGRHERSVQIEMQRSKRKKCHTTPTTTGGVNRLVSSRRAGVNKSPRPASGQGRVQRYRHGSVAKPQDFERATVEKKLFQSPSKDLGELTENLQLYLSTPWDAKTKRFFSETEYNALKKRYLALARKTRSWPKQLGERFCLTPHHVKSTDQPELFETLRAQLCQSHAGDLLQHSQWTAAQMLQWFDTDSEIIKGLDRDTAVVAAYYHDIGKGGHCKRREGPNHEYWYDVYSMDDSKHPDFGAEMVLGWREYHLCTCRSTIQSCTQDISAIIGASFPRVNLHNVAVAIAIHWDFGWINIPSPEVTRSDKVRMYVAKFRQKCTEYGARPSVGLLKLCIAVSCADISAGMPSRIKPTLRRLGLDPTPKYLGVDPWVAYGMDKIFMVLRAEVLHEFSAL